MDGVLAPIVPQPDDAHMPETTRRPLIEVAKRYGTVACVSGRRASDARRIVALGSIAYLGSHGSEVLRPGAIAPELDRELQAWTRRVQAFAHEAYGDKGAGLVGLLRDTDLAAAVYVGDDTTDLDAFRGLSELQEMGRLGYALRVGVRSDESPSALQDEADTMVEGPDGVRELLRALLL